jgi:RNA:NAD 2'-phosphotransferase (TPT1/KptA family)
VAAARLLHGRASERAAVLRAGIRPIARAVVRLARDARRG